MRKQTVDISVKRWKFIWLSLSRTMINIKSSCSSRITYRNEENKRAMTHTWKEITRDIFRFLTIILCDGFWKQHLTNILLICVKYNIYVENDITGMDRVLFLFQSSWLYQISSIHLWLDQVWSWDNWQSKCAHLLWSLWSCLFAFAQQVVGVPRLCLFL